MKIKEKIKGDLIKGFVNAELMDMIKENALPYRKLMSYYRCAMMEIETKFNVLNDQFSLQYERNPIESIKTRLKSPESLLRKLRKKDLPVTIESVEDNIYDVAGIRVICSFIEDIYNLAECLLRQDDIKLIEIKDYLSKGMLNKLDRLLLDYNGRVLLQSFNPFMVKKMALSSLKRYKLGILLTSIRFVCYCLFLLTSSIFVFYIICIYFI